VTGTGEATICQNRQNEAYAQNVKTSISRKNCPASAQKWVILVDVHHGCVIALRHVHGLRHLTLEDNSCS